MLSRGQCFAVMLFFFFKQKTAYEIYQCDWSSDVCSSDLLCGDHMHLLEPFHRTVGHVSQVTDRRTYNIKDAFGIDFYFIVFHSGEFRANIKPKFFVDGVKLENGDFMESTSTGTDSGLFIFFQNDDFFSLPGHVAMAIQYTADFHMQRLGF